LLENSTDPADIQTRENNQGRITTLSLQRDTIAENIGKEYDD
jgi:hypothetical protein